MHIRTLRCQRRGTGQKTSRVHGERVRTLGHHVQQRGRGEIDPRVRSDRAGHGPVGLRQAHGGERARSGGVCEARGEGDGGRTREGEHRLYGEHRGECWQREVCRLRDVEACGAGVGEVRELEAGCLWDTRELCFTRASWDANVEGHLGV
ncbi:hypothetical protein SO802_020644 [Lithocarpus litseifolius]|uniref:Uncharacterized protein n=1 Tax=Lithocarpus litseifolius TaxID=425828 RepID=A0AAW2CEM4_9ROSI